MKRILFLSGFAVLCVVSALLVEASGYRGPVLTGLAVLIVVLLALQVLMLSRLKRDLLAVRSAPHPVAALVHEVRGGPFRGGVVVDGGPDSSPTPGPAPVPVRTYERAIPHVRRWFEPAIPSALWHLGRELGIPSCVTGRRPSAGELVEAWEEWLGAAIDKQAALAKVFQEMRRAEIWWIVAEGFELGPDMSFGAQEREAFKALVERATGLRPARWEGRPFVPFDSDVALRNMIDSESDALFRREWVALHHPRVRDLPQPHDVRVVGIRVPGLAARRQGALTAPFVEAAEYVWI